MTAITTTISQTMPIAEAEKSLSLIGEHLSDIAGHVGEMRRLAADLDARRGWQTLGYKSIGACLKDRFNALESAQVYRVLAAAKVERNLLGKTTGEIPERQLRELSKFDEEAQTALWTIATRTAPGGRVTTGHLKSIVEVAVGLVREGGLDDGQEVRPIGQLLTANILEETAERMKRNQQYIIDRHGRAQAKTLINAQVSFHAAADGRILLYADRETVAAVAALIKAGKRIGLLIVKETPALAAETEI